MSRSGYSDDIDDNWALIKWRGQVSSAIRGKRGQSFLKELLSALDAMPEKRLIADDLIVEAAELYGPPTRLEYYRDRRSSRECGVCAIGSLGVQRGINLSALDPDDYDGIAAEFGIAHQLVQEIEWINDEGGSYKETPEERWGRVRCWVVEQIRELTP